MSNDYKNPLIRWSGRSIGLNLSKDEEILYIDDHAIITGVKGYPNRLIATYAFNPNVLSASLQLELTNLRYVILTDFGFGNDLDKFYPIPEWLMTMNKIEKLVLANAELNSIAFCENFPLTYLDVRKAQYNDKVSVLKTIKKLHELKILVHDESLSTEDLSTIKESLPDVKFASKASKRKSSS